MHSRSASRIAFALVWIGLGIQGLVTGKFTIVWASVPKGFPDRDALVYLTALVGIASGICLLSGRLAAYGARALLALLAVWLVTFRLLALFSAPLIAGTWSFGYALILVGAALVPFVWFATQDDRRRVGFVTGNNGLRLAQACYGIGLLPFGYAHFAAVQPTAELVPSWLPWHLGWAYLTGATFVAAGIAIATGKLARLATVLSVVQMALFGLLVWVPRTMAGSLNEFQKGEVVTNVILVVMGWMIVESFDTDAQDNLTTA